MGVLVISEPGEAAARHIVGALSGNGSKLLLAKSVDEATKVVRDTRANGLILGPSLADDDALAEIADLKRDTPVAVVLVTQELDAEFLRRSMRIGVSDVLTKDAGPEELFEAVKAAVASVAASGAVAVAEAEQSPAKTATVVTVFSTKGGVGKTVLATNIATTLATEHKRSVVLVDLDLQFGDVGIVLGLVPERTIVEAAQSYDRLDPAMLQALLTTHASGVRVLLAPTRPEDAEAITAGRVGGIIQMLRGMFDFVVIDTAPAFNDVTLAALDNSDLVYLLTMMDVASVKNTRVTMQKLSQLGYSKEMLRLVLNRADSKVFLNVAEVERAVGGSISGRIPSDLLVPRSVNKGIPVVLDAPRSKVARSLAELAEEAVTMSAVRG